MSFPRYPKYKASGVEWLGDLPAHWHSGCLKYLATIKPGYAFSSDNFVGEGIPVLRIGDITPDGTVDFTDARCLPLEQGTAHADVLVVRGDIVMAMTGATIGKAGWYDSDRPALLNQRVCIFRSIAPNEQRYLWHILRARFYAEHITLAAVGGAQPNISDSQLLQCIVPLPPGPEQIAIAAFLDRETAKIDALVAEQRRLVELLKEKRRAVISHAVTQGLNPHAPMKPSGIEWLGDVPEHWEVTRFKRIAELIDGDRSSAYPSDQDIVDEGIPFLSSKNIVGYKFFNTGLRFITQEKFDALSRGKILDNDLAITVRGTIGQVAIYDAKLLGHPTAFINAQMMIMRPIGVTSSFVHSISESHYWQKQLDVASYGTAQQQLSNAILQNIFVVLPPAKERDEISIFLVTELAKFDEAQRAIELLQERRTALISAAVTGQIDVRGLPPAR